MVEGLGSPLDPWEDRQGLREQPIISNSNMWQEKDLMGLMSHFPPHQPAIGPPSPLFCLATVQIVDRTPRLAKRRAKKRGQERGLIFACPSIVSGGKKWQHRVQFFSPQSSSGPAREARLTDDSQHLCYAAVTDEGLHITIFLFLSVYRTLPLSSHKRFS